MTTSPTHESDEQPWKAPGLTGLLAVLAALRDPEGGCPWDLEQNHQSMASYLVEEVYEVLDAIEREDDEELRDELGDLLFLVAFHSQLAAERSAFTLHDVAESVRAKMVRRHPHVFAVEGQVLAEHVPARWEASKRAEGRGTLDGVPPSLPALLRAHRLTKKAATVGFDWSTTNEVFAKVDEEIAELRQAVEQGDVAHVEEEIGDLLFCIANLARKLDVEPEQALRGTLDKFTRRFGHIEKRLANDGRSPEESTLAEMDALWNEAKGMVG